METTAAEVQSAEEKTSTTRVPRRYIYRRTRSSSDDFEDTKFTPPKRTVESAADFERRIQTFVQQENTVKLVEAMSAESMKELQRRQNERQARKAAANEPVEQLPDIFESTHFAFEHHDQLSDGVRQTWTTSCKKDSTLLYPHHWLRLASTFSVQSKTARQPTLLPLKHKKHENYLKIRDQQNRVYAVEAVAEGVKCYQQGQTADALDFYKRALDMDPKYAEGWFRAGESLLAEMKRRDAVEQLERALRIDPEHMGAKELLCAIQNEEDSKTKSTPDILDSMSHVSKESKSSSRRKQRRSRSRSPSRTERIRNRSPRRRWERSRSRSSRRRRGRSDSPRHRRGRSHSRESGRDKSRSSRRERDRERSESTSRGREREHARDDRRGRHSRANEDDRRRRRRRNSPREYTRDRDRKERRSIQDRSRSASPRRHRDEERSKISRREHRRNYRSPSPRRRHHEVSKPSRRYKSDMEHRGGYRSRRNSEREQGERDEDIRNQNASLKDEHAERNHGSGGGSHEIREESGYATRNYLEQEKNQQRKLNEQTCRNEQRVYSELDSLSKDIDRKGVD